MASTDNVFDLLIVGGGVNGAGIARDASGRGLRVLLCEQSDLASATSSASSKLIHGGLRYLEMYAFRLVREALAEREVLLKAAPHIIWPMRFVLPHNKLLRPAWMVRMGLFMYDHLSSRPTLPGTKTLKLRETLEGASLNADLVKGFAYSDCWVEDSRLVVLNAMDAQTRGAEILVRTECSRAERRDGLWHATLRDTVTGAERAVQARAVVNAAGPWVDLFLRQGLGNNQAQHLRLVKGSHIIVPKLYEGPHAYILQNTDKRVVFAIPYEHDYTLIGTTDIPYDGDPGEVTIADDEVKYLCDAVNAYFTRSVSPADAVSAYSGVRPLYDDHKTNNPSAVTRDYMFDVEGKPGEPPLLSIYGGKITTYRRLAEHAMKRLEPHFKEMRAPWTESASLPGGDMAGADFDAFLAGLRGRYPFLPEDLSWRYARLYGTLADSFLGGATSLDDLGDHFGAGLYVREVEYLMERDWARTAEDILWRRTKVGLRMPEDGKARLAEWLHARPVAA